MFYPQVKDITWRAEKTVAILTIFFERRLNMCRVANIAAVFVGRFSLKCTLWYLGTLGFLNIFTCIYSWSYVVVTISIIAIQFFFSISSCLLVLDTVSFESSKHDKLIIELNW